MIVFQEPFIRKEKWGKIKNQDIWLFELTNKKGSSIKISNFGCLVQSFQIRNNDKQIDIVLGYPNLKNYINDTYYMGCVVGRCTGRISKASINKNEKLNNLCLNRNEFHHHGGENGFNKKIWSIADEQSNQVTFHYKSIDGEEGYPGNLDVWVKYKLEDDDDTWSVEYEAKTDKATIINLTQHSYFNLEGHDSGNIESHVIRINAEKFLPVNEFLLPTGKLASVQGTPFDFTERKSIGLRIDETNDQLILGNGYDHTWVLEEQKSEQIKHAARVTAKKSGIELNVFTSEPAIHFYTGNFLQNVKGKENSNYNERSGFCLETQHFPDAPNHFHFPDIALEPGDTFRSKTIFQFSAFDK